MQHASRERFDAFINGDYHHIKTQESNNINKSDSTNNLHETVFDKSDKNYKGLYRKIHSDDLFLEAQRWGIFPRYLYSLARDNGEHRIKDVIHRIKKLGDSYFREGEPIEQQRAKVFHAEMKRLRSER